LPAEEARRRREQLANRDADGAAERVEQVGLVAEWHLAGGIAHPGLGVEQVAHFKPNLGAAQPRLPGDQVEALAQVREQPQVERRQRREAQAAAVRAVDPRAAAPVGRQARAEAVVRPARLRLDFVARPPVRRSERGAAQIIEPGDARPDGDLVERLSVCVSENCSRPPRKDNLVISREVAMGT